MKALTFLLGIALAAGGIAACGSPAVPPDSSPPDVVLNAYLVALERGDCATAHALATSTFVVGDGELCGAVVVSAYTPLTTAATPFAGEVEYSTTLTITRGSGDGSVGAGERIWFYQLDQQPGGAWRLTGGGSGP